MVQNYFVDEGAELSSSGEHCYDSLEDLKRRHSSPRRKLPVIPTNTNHHTYLNRKSSEQGSLGRNVKEIVVFE